MWQEKQVVCKCVFFAVSKKLKRSDNCFLSFHKIEITLKFGWLKCTVLKLKPLVFSLWWKRHKILFSETKKVGSMTEIYLYISIFFADGFTDFQITPSNCNTHGYWFLCQPKQWRNIRSQCFQFSAYLESGMFVKLDGIPVHSNCNSSESEMLLRIFKGLWLASFRCSCETRFLS